jgi:hypothetical protein
MKKKGLSNAIAAGVIVLAMLSATGCSSCKKQSKTVPKSGGSLAELSSNAAADGVERFQTVRAEDVSLDNGHGFAHVTYKPTVKMFEDSEIRSSLMGIGSDGHGFVFQNASPGIRALKAGDVLMVKGEMAGKVLGTVSREDKTLVVIDQASLVDVVQGGEIHLDAPVQFHGHKRAACFKPGVLLNNLLSLVDTPVYAQSPENARADAARQKGAQDAAKNAAGGIYKFFTDGWKVTKWEMTASDGQVNFALVMTKKKGGFVAMIGMKGWMGNFDFVTDLKLNGSVSQIVSEVGNMQIYQGIKNSKGSLEFDWEIGTDTPGIWVKEDRVKLPAGLSIPLAPLLGGLPLTLDVSSALLIHPALTGGSEYSQGGFTLAWGGDGKIETKSGGAVSGDSNIELTYDITSDANVSPVAPNGMVISFCAPRIELRLDFLGPFASKLAAAGSTMDSIVSGLESLLPESVQGALSGVTASAILSSNADIFVEFIATEGVTHSSNQTPAPCSKQEVKFTGRGGVSAQLFGLTKGAERIKDLFTKTYTRWNPASDFCKGV